MPSKKSRRDKAATHTFFKQDPVDGCPLSCCTCSTPNNNGSGDQSRFKNVDPNDYHAAMDECDKIAKNFKKLLAQEYKRRAATVLTQYLPTEWGLSHLQAWETLNEVDQLNSEADIESHNNDYRQAQKILESESFAKMIVSEPGTLRFSKLMVDVKHLNNVMYRCCLSMHFFNIEKIFGFPEEMNQGLTTKQDSKTGTMQLELKPEISLRQWFNAPVRMVSNKRKPKENVSPSKKLPALTALADMKRHCKWLSKDIQAILKSISDDYSHVCELPDDIWAYGQNIPQDLPPGVRECLWDLAFLAEEMVGLLTALVELRDQILSTLLIWIGSGEEVWKWGVEQMHNLPDFQKYEYMRIDMYTMHMLSFRDEEKLIEWFLTRKTCPSNSTTATLKAWFKVGKQTQADRAALFGERYAALQATFEPADVMVESLEKYQHDLEAQAKNTVGSADWLRKTVEMLPKDLVRSLAMQHKPS